MKKLLMLVLTLSFMMVSISGPVMAKKVGDIKEGIFTDKNHKFSMAALDGWSTKIGSSEKAPLRLTMLEKSYPVPQDFQGGGKEDFAQTPTIKVLVDTCSVSVEDFINNLSSHDYDSDQKKYFLKQLTLIKKPHEVQTSSDVTIQGEKAVIVNVRQAYTKEISSTGSDRASVINDYISGYILYTVREGKVYVFTLCTEYKMASNYATKWNQLVNSIKFDVK
ncbi:MAG: hypothetical protein R3F48_09565 [Candidatus Zixiibacteriota bacterium]